jgi:uncharacterized protein YbjT (DUF2867 family)
LVLGRKLERKNSLSRKTTRALHTFAMAPLKTIVFGPTGRVGSAASRAARKEGVDVVLAMRDSKKSIPSLTTEEESQGGYERVEADLTNPKTVQAAVEKTAAKRAFIYIAWESQDGMKGSVAALKSAGIEFVVLLSSWSVEGDIRAIQPDDFVGWVHAQVEISLLDVFGPGGYVAIRPAWFASNSFWYKNQIPSGEVKLAYPEPEYDWVSPDDIGALAGKCLVQGPKILDITDESNVVFLAGPERLSQRDAIGIISKVIGKHVKVTRVDESEGLAVFVKTTGMPETLAQQLLEGQKLLDEVEGAAIFHRHRYPAASSNIQRHLARPPIRFPEWVKTNRQEFDA